MIPPYKVKPIEETVNFEVGDPKEHQLYNIETDKGQQTNLANSEKEKLKETRRTSYRDIELK